jgi:glycosyltransferase involved in cell wall biosynthesis
VFRAPSDYHSLPMPASYCWQVPPPLGMEQRAYALGLVEAMRRLDPSVDHKVVERGQAPPHGTDVLITFDGMVSRNVRTATAVLSPPGGRIGIAQRWRIARAAAMADLVLAPSAEVVDGLLRVFRTPAHKVVLAPPVLPERYGRPSSTEAAAARIAFGAPVRYFVLAGPSSVSSTVPHISLPHSMPAEARRALIAGAVVYVDSSMVDGITLGVMQALACGTPAIVAKGGTLAAVLDGAGIAVDRKRGDRWSAAVNLLHANDGLRAGLSKRAVEVAAGFRDPERLRGLAVALARLRLAGAMGVNAQEPADRTTRADHSRR